MLNITQFLGRLLLGLSALNGSIVAPPTFRLPAESVAFRQAQLASANHKPVEKLSQYARYDFGPLWMQTNNQVVVGFIGPNCQRLRVKMLSVRRDTADFTRYYLTGKTQVAGHISTFSGTLVLRQLRELRKLEPITEAASDAAIKAFRSARQEGFVLVDYELSEKVGQPKSGVFRGMARTNWYVDRNGRLRYDELYGAGDGYCNNQCVGTWTSYATQKPLRCNWGDYRIPNAGDFDIGAGEFSPASTYYSQGWQYYAMLSNPKISEQARARALKSERRTWWK